MKKVKRYAEGGYESTDDATNLLAAEEREGREFRGMGKDVTDETGTKSRLKRNLETGELYDPEGSDSEKPAKTTSKSKPLRTAFQKRAAKQQAARDARKARAGSGTSPLGQVSDIVAAKTGGMIKASKRADGCAQRGKTKGRVI